jgi:hypothetical protein
MGAALLRQDRHPPTADVLAERQTRRLTAPVDPPLILETPKIHRRSNGCPVPLGRINNAIMLGMSCDTGEDAKRRDAAATVELAGIAASRGVYQGRARVVTAPADFGRLVQGDVAPMATPDPVSGAPDYWVIEFGTR